MAAIFVAVHMIAERKITLELSLSFMLTGKWCIDSFVYSALCMDDGQKNLSEKCTGVSACFSLSPCRRSQSCSYHHYALSLHCSHSVAWQRGSVAAWARATYLCHVNGMDTVGWSVGLSMQLVP